MAGPAWEDSGLVFTNEFGRYVSYRAIFDSFKRIVKRIGLPDARIHDLRHPYVKHTTKNKSLQKQKSQTTNDNLIVWDFCFFDLCRAVVLKILSAGWHFY